MQGSGGGASAGAGAVVSTHTQSSVPPTSPSKDTGRPIWDLDRFRANLNPVLNRPMMKVGAVMAMVRQRNAAKRIAAEAMMQMQNKAEDEGEDEEETYTNVCSS